MNNKKGAMATMLILSLMTGPVFAQSGKADDGDIMDQAIQMGCEARQEITDRVNQFWEDAEQVVCDQLDTENRYQESPYLWVSKDAQCNMSYQMPGLPNMAGMGSSSCEALQSITGKLVDEANKQFQGAVDNALQSVGRDKGEVKVDLGNLARDVISNQK